MTLFVEPWGDEFPMLSGETMELTFNGPGEGRLTITHADNALMVYGWSGSTYESRFE